MTVSFLHFRFFRASYLVTILLAALTPSLSVSQNRMADRKSAMSEFSESFVHEARHYYDWHDVENALSKELGISSAECYRFFSYLFKSDRNDFLNYLKKVKAGEINKANALQYWMNLLPEYVSLYKNYTQSPQFNQKTTSAANPSPNVGGALCNNLDFSNGTTSGWTGKYNDDFYGNNYYTSPGLLPISGLYSSWGYNSWNYLHELTTPGTDYFTPISTVPPGHSYALRLGNADAEYNLYPYNHQVISNTFLVTNSNSMLNYWYAVVLSQFSVGAHDEIEQPYFKIRVFDQWNTPITCASYDVNATSAATIGGFVRQSISTSNEVMYKDWSQVMIPLTNYIGQYVTIQFETSDCNQGAHFGYAYLAVDCAQFQTINSASKLCAGGTVTITAPSGAYSYSWSGPGVISGFSSQTATVNAAGTYTVNMTSIGNSNTLCSYSLTTTVVQDPLMNITSSPVNVSCYGGSNGSASVSVSGGTASYYYSWAPSGGTLNSVSGLSAGNYTCTVTDAVGCTKTQVVTITQPSAALSASLSAQTNVSCYGGSTGSATVGASGGTPGYTYSWSPSGGSSASATNLSAGNYTCTITDSKGCTTTRSATITQPSSVVGASVSAQTNVNCYGASTGSATVTASGGTPGYTYSWSPSGGSTANATNLSAGNYTCTVTDSKGCTSTRTVTITQPSATLSGAISAQTNVDCYGGSTGSASVTASGGTPGYTYSWSPSGGSSANATNLSAGNYTCTVTDSKGCTSTRTVAITQPSAALSGAINAQTNVNCYGGSTGSASVTASGGTPGYTYSWSPSGGSTANATNLSAGTYTCTITDSKGCTSTRTATITQPSAALSASLSAQTNVDCYGNNSGSATITPNGGTPLYTYNWLPSGGTSATAVNLLAGTYTCSITDSKGCNTTQTVVITQPASGMSASIVSQTNVNCFGQSTGAATVTANGGSGTYNYSWTPGGGNSATATGLSAGSYTCSVTDGSGCATVKIVTITQPPVLTAQMEPKNNVSCFGLSDGSANMQVSGGSPSYSYNWQPTGGNNALASGLSAGNYTCTVSDTKGCTLSKQVNISQPTSALSANISAQTNASCHGDSNGSASTLVNGGTPTYTYHWLPAGGSNSTISNIGAGTYTCTIKDLNGCELLKSVTIGEPDAMAISITANDVCSGETSNIAANVSGGNGSYTYSWAPNGLTTSGFTVALHANASYTLTVKDNKNCVSTKTVAVSLKPNPVAAIAGNATNSVYYMNYAPIEICLQDASTDAVQLNWTFDNSQIANTTNPCFKVTAPGEYCVNLEVKSSGGCIDKTTACYKVELKELQVPNIFTPNLDGVNDMFNLHSIGYENISVEIFDRWGLRLYSWEGLAGGWNGKLENGDDAVAGTYYWIAEIREGSGKVITKKGFFLLSR